MQTLLLWLLSLLFGTLAHCHCCVALLCYSLHSTALPSVEITKLDSHLRYCTLTATPPAFLHSALAATLMPVASLRLLTRLDSAATAARPGMLSDTSRACNTHSLGARTSFQSRLFPCQPRSFGAPDASRPSMPLLSICSIQSRSASPRQHVFCPLVSYCRCP